MRKLLEKYLIIDIELKSFLEKIFPNQKKIRTLEKELKTQNHKIESKEHELKNEYFQIVMNNLNLQNQNALKKLKCISRKI